MATGGFVCSMSWDLWVGYEYTGSGKQQVLGIGTCTVPWVAVPGQNGSGLGVRKSDPTRPAPGRSGHMWLHLIGPPLTR